MDKKYLSQKRYDENHTTQIKLKLNDITDADILAKLNEQDNKQGYVKALIRKDIAQNETMYTPSAVK